MRRRWLLACAALALGGAGFWWARTPRLSVAALRDLHARPLPAPQAGLSVFHLGHSLVGRDMPAMVTQLAQAAGFAAHRHASQLGWGASLAQHRDGPDAVPGFAEENATAAFRPADAALASGDHDAVVLTEMVEIRDAVAYHDSARALADWAVAARAGNPAVRIYLYETWHRLDDPEGWLTRIDADLARHWEGDLLRAAKARPGTGTIHVIPGGQVLARVTRAMEAGEIPGLARREDLFARDPQGALDPIHLNDLGAYVIALTHFSALYHRSPEGLPHQLTRADGQPATALPVAAVVPIQRLVWQVVTGYRGTGVAG